MHMSGLESDKKHSVLINYFESPINLNVAVCDVLRKRGQFLTMNTWNYEYLEKAGATL